MRATADPPGPAGEARLVEACRAGDASAGRELFERYSGRVHAVALHFFGGNAALAADVTQEVFVKALTGMDRFRGEAQVATWLHRITVRACLDSRRSTRRLVPLDGGLQAPASASPARDAEQSRREAEVRAAVSRLPPKLRIAVVLRHFEEMSYEEMATALGCSAGTVASRLSRGHAQLARELAMHRGDIA